MFWSELFRKNCSGIALFERVRDQTPRNLGSFMTLMLRPLLYQADEKRLDSKAGQKFKQPNEPNFFNVDVR